ncbi:hypothetical protein [Micropruina sp.]|uniref:hypothetical protein n=1 Tax=Micropruina sp. TaxID=2737536 RepID=UPI0039E454FB
MLYLDAPFHTIDGVAVFGDHADRQQWYYLPGVPRIATVNGLPQLSLIKFKGTAGTGGFLNVDVDLGLDPDVVDELAGRIAAIENLPEPPRLAQLPVIDGTVRMMLFDAETPVPVPPGGAQPQPAPVDPDALKFVLKLSHAAKPALYGDNRAAFSVQLTHEGITTLEQAMRGVLSPIGIVYSLDFLGMRPAYHVSVHADWDLIQKHLEEHEEFSLPLVYQSSIDKFVDSLVESRAIEIKADTFVLEEDGSAVIARRDQAMDDIRDMITETFFEPTLDPIDSSDAADKGVRTAGRIMQAIASAGASENCMFRRREVDVTRIESKRLDVTMSERITIKRTVYPQGHLSGLFRTLTDQGLPLDQFVTEVDLDDPWFERRRLKVIARAEWASDQVRSISVLMSYGGEVQSLLLTSAQPEAEVSWSSRLVGGGMAREVELTYTVNFAGVDGTERPISLTSQPQTVLVDAIEIDPRELYSISPVPVVALSYPWDRYPNVEVELSYADPAEGIAQDDVLLLNSTATEQTWPMFVRNPELATGRFRVTHRAVDQRDLVGQWGDIESERIIVRDPYPNGLILDVVPVLNWTVVKRAFVDLSYTDLEHNIVEQESFEFSATAEATQQFKVRLADVTRRDVDYRVTFVNADGSVVEVPPSVTAGRRITVRADMLGHRLVRVRSAPDADFAGAKVRELTVELRYTDTAAGIEVADRVQFHAAGESDAFEFDYVDATRTGFEYRVTTTFTNNLSRTRDWAPSDESDLVVGVR